MHTPGSKISSSRFCDLRLKNPAFSCHFRRKCRTSSIPLPTLPTGHSPHNLSLLPRQNLIGSTKRMSQSVLLILLDARPGKPGDENNCLTMDGTPGKTDNNSSAPCDNAENKTPSTKITNEILTEEELKKATDNDEERTTAVNSETTLRSIATR